MEQKIDNELTCCNIEKYIGGNEINNYNITIYKQSEREFLVTHNANIKPVSYFTGRETELKYLRQRIEAGQKSILISGMGGIGKTHICRKLFEEYLNKYAKGEKIPFCHIGYIEYNGDIGSSLQNCLKYKKQDSLEQNQEAAWKELEYLASNGKLLLFVDNVNVTIREDRGLERLKSIPGVLVLTSRRISFSKEFELYKIGFLNIEQYKKIYEKIRYKDDTKKILEKDVSNLEYIINELAAGHTITIEFLAHLAETKNWTVKRLRNELERHGFRLEYKDEEDELINIQKSYETLYDLSELTKAEQNILEAFSVFPYIPLVAEICNQWLLSDAGVGVNDDILINLYRKGWLQFDVVRESYSLHPVFAWFIYDKCKPGIEKHHELIKECRKSLEIPEGGSILKCQNYIPFAETIINKLNMNDIREQTEILNTLAYLLQYIGRYKEAYKFYKKLLTIYEQTKSYSCLDIAIVYQNLAYIHIMQKQYEIAKKLFNISQSFLDSKNKSKKNTLIIATNYNNLGYIYQMQEKYDDAEIMYEKSMQIQRNIFGEKNPNIVRSYNNLAYIYECQKKYKKAEKFYILGLQIDKSDSFNTAIIYNNLAKLYEKKREHKSAFTYFFRAYRILFLILGSDNERTQIVYKNMQIVYTKLNIKKDFNQWLEEKMKKSEL